MSDVNTLQAEIEATKQLLAQKKQELKDAKSKILGNPFSHFVATVTKKATAPFVSLHNKTTKMLEQPKEYHAEVVFNKAAKALTAARKLKDATQEKKTKMAVRCAQVVMQIEEFVEANETELNHNLTETAKLLDEQVQYLRPPHDEELSKKFTEFVVGKVQEL
jgi:hypothetical protein